MVFGGSLLAVFMVVGGSVWVIKNSAEPTQTIEKEKPTVRQPTKFYNTVISPDGNYLVTLKGTSINKVWNVNLDFVGKDNQHGIDWINNPSIDWGEMNKETAWAYNKSFFGRWRKDNKQLVIAINNEIHLWTFEEDKSLIGSGEDEKDHWDLKTVKHEQKTAPVNYKEGYKNIIFLGQNKVAVTTAENLYQILPDEKEIQSTAGVFHSEFSSLPGDDGYSYLEKEGDYKVKGIVVVRNGTTRFYKTPLEKWSQDYAGEIKLSPDLKYGCVLVASSGHSGYVVFKLGDSQEIAIGQQYSECKGWIDERQVVLWEKSYFSQWNTATYLLDVVTGKRSLLFDQTDYDW